MSPNAGELNRIAMIGFDELTGADHDQDSDNLCEMSVFLLLVLADPSLRATEIRKLFKESSRKTHSMKGRPVRRG